jgi:hypothetical protein
MVIIKLVRKARSLFALQLCEKIFQKPRAATIRQQSYRLSADYCKAGAKRAGCLYLENNYWINNEFCATIKVRRVALKGGT